MKKTLFALFVLAFFSFPLITQAIVTNASYDYKTLYYFCDDSTICEDTKNWLNDTLKDDNKIKTVYLDSNTESELLTKVRKELEIKKDNLPLIIVGSDYVSGFNKKAQKKIVKLIKAYESENEYCDAILEIKSDRDIHECLLKNTGIYGNSNNYIMPTFLITATLSVVIALIIYTKQKRRLHQ